MSFVLRRACAVGIASLAIAVPAVSALSVTSAAAAPADVKINEVESNGGLPNDWVELINTGTTSVDLSGYIFRDNSAINAVLPPGTTIAAGGYLVLDNAGAGALFTVGLGASDQARLFAPDGTTVIDSYTWTTHAATTYGRCANGTGSFVVQPASSSLATTSATKGAANDCGGGSTTTTVPGPSSALPWPGDAAVQDASSYVFGGNLSGLIYEPSGTSAPGVIWGARNGPGSLFRLVFDSGTSKWVPDTANGWSAGKLVKYTDGLGEPDAEGVTFGGAGSSGGVYIASERNNSSNATSRNAILRFDPSAPGATLTATNEWNLTANLPVTGANLGLEGITWIPDSFLVSQGFVDESTSALYNPANYPDHAGGLLFVGVEQNGVIYAFALNHTTNAFTRIATISSGFPAVMELQFDRELGELWAVCDNTCNGRSSLLRIDSATGKFANAFTFDRPAAMPDINNEGFAIAPAALCSNNRKPAYWADDSETSGVALRSGTVPCAVASTVAQLPAALLLVVLGGVVMVGAVAPRRRRLTVTA
jgi:hypothetical protein